MLCAVPTLPAHPRLQPRDLAKYQVGLKTMPGPKEDASPQRQIHRANLFQFQCTFRLLRWAPLAQGSGLPMADRLSSQPTAHRARSLMHIHFHRTTKQTQHHKPTTPAAPRTPEREANQRDAATGALGHHATSQPTPAKNGCTQTHTKDRTETQSEPSHEQRARGMPPEHST